MANNISAYVPVIIEKTIPILREHLTFFRHVTTDYDPGFASVGNSLQIPVTATIDTSDVTPSNVAPALTSLTPTSVTLTLDNLKRAPFSATVTDLDKMMLNSDFIPSEIQEAARSLAKNINTTAFAQYKNIPYYVGTAGTNPFASNLNTLASAKLSLDNTLAEEDNRVMVLSNNAVYGANTLGNLIQAYQRGSDATLNTGNPGNLFGFNIVRDSTVPTHTAGTASGVLINGAVTAGATTAAIDTGTGTLVVGDIFTVAGDTNTYVVTAAVADVSSATMSFYPAAQTNWANNAAVTVKAAHVCNIGMTRGAFALGMRAPRCPELAINTVIPFVDDQGPEATGMTFALSFVPGYWAQTMELVALYGACTLRPEKAVIMAG